MSHSGDLLSSGETVMYRTTLHWVVFAPPVGYAMLAFFSFLLHPLLGVIFTGVFFVCLMMSLAKYFTTEIILTDRRVLHTKGWLRKDVSEILLPKIESIDVQQDMLARLLMYGKITLIGTGGTHRAFTDIRNALTLRHHLHALIEEKTQQASRPQAADPGVIPIIVDEAEPPGIVACAGCGRSLMLVPEVLGRMVKCPSCGCRMRMPDT